MKKSIILSLLLSVSLVSANAQTQGSKVGARSGFGFQLNQYQNDFGFGLSMSSGYFAHDNIAVRIKANLMYNENVQNGETDWSPYANVSVGLVGVGGMVGEHIRLYGEGGFIGLFPSGEFSTENFVFGGYGIFGFEFFMTNHNNYFIELGGVGTGAIADKIEYKPVYSNGFSISTGFRFFLK